jgi:hypothetical protein
MTPSCYPHYSIQCGAKEEGTTIRCFAKNSREASSLILTKEEGYHYVVSQTEKEFERNISRVFVFNLFTHINYLFSRKIKRNLLWVKENILK